MPRRSVVRIAAPTGANAAASGSSVRRKSEVPSATHVALGPHVIREHGRAEHDDDVVRRELLGETRSRRREEARERRMDFGKAAARRQRAHPHRRSGALGERDDGVPRSVTVDSRAHHQRRVRAVVQRRRHGPERLGFTDEVAAHLTRRDLVRRRVPIVLGDRHERRPLRWLHRGVVRAGDRRGDIRRASGLDAPLHIRLGQLGRLLGEEERLAREQLARLLARGDHERRLVAHRREDAAERMADAHRGVQVHEPGVAGRLRVAVRHRNGGRLLQREHVPEVRGRVLEEAQLGRTRVAEDRRHPERAHQRMGRRSDGVAHSRRLFAFQLRSRFAMSAGL